MKHILPAAVLLLSAAAMAEDNLISPCFGPAAQELYIEALGVRAQGKTN